MSGSILQFPRLSLFVLLCFLLLGSGASLAEDTGGVMNDKIVFGQTADLSGIVSSLGLGMKEGVLAAFNEANKKGGVHGRQLALISYDDLYDPDLAVDNAKKLIHEDHVFALVGGVGTPTANTIWPFATREKVPFIGQYTGVEFLRSPFKRYVLNIRSSYWQETEAWIDYLTSDLGIERIAILYQDDTYGRAGLTGVKRALKKRGLSLVDEATYVRGTVAVKNAVLRLRRTKADAVVMVSTDKPASKFIRLSQQLGYEPVFINMSFANLRQFDGHMGEYTGTVIASQVVPVPYDSEKSFFVSRYQGALKAFDPKAEYGFVSLEGYAVGRFVIFILEQMASEDLLSDDARERFIDKVYALKDISLDDLDLHFGKNDNQGMEDVFMTLLQKDGTLKAIRKNDSKVGH